MSGTRLSTASAIAPRRLHQRVSLAVANNTMPLMGSPAGLHHRKYAIHRIVWPSTGRGPWGRGQGGDPPPLPFVPISNGAGINLQAEVTALRTCLISGPRQVLPCTLPHHTTARLRGVGAPSTLASAGQKNEQFKGTDVEKKRGVRVTKDGAPWTLIPLPDFLVRSLARQRKKATTLYEIQVVPSLHGRRSKVRARRHPTPPTRPALAL